MGYKKPFLLIIAGANGSGKSSVAYRHVKDTLDADYVHFDPDRTSEVAYESPDGKRYVLWRDVCLILRLNIVIETTLSYQSSINFIEKALEQKYFVKLIYVATKDVNINIGRIKKRAKTQGPYVPSKIATRNYVLSMINCLLYINKVDEFEIIDNS